MVNNKISWKEPNFEPYSVFGIQLNKCKKMTELKLICFGNIYLFSQTCNEKVAQNYSASSLYLPPLQFLN